MLIGAACIDIVQKCGYDYRISAHLYIPAHMSDDDESNRLR